MNTGVEGAASTRGSISSSVFFSATTPEKYLQLVMKEFSPPFSDIKAGHGPKVVFICIRFSDP